MNKTWTVSANNPVNYSVEFVNGIFDPDNLTLVGGDRSARRLIVTDETVGKEYGVAIQKYANLNMREHETLVIPHGEENKGWNAVEMVLKAMKDFQLDRRREPVIAVGGGVLTDIVGFACSIYRRNTPFIRIPTTLIGIVDASVGIKTGVNHHAGKNKIGTYFAATRSLLDPKFLSTLDPRHVSNGMAEILKIGLIKDSILFELLEDNGQDVLQSKFQHGTAVESDILSRAIEGMLAELQPNLWEHNLERLVDYGHTFSPTIEMRALPELLHGEAVCLDMALTTAIAVRRKMVTEKDADRVFSTMKSLDLPTNHASMSEADLLEALDDTTRHRDGLQRVPLPIGIGHATFVNDLTVDDIRLGLNMLNNLAN